MSEPRHPDIEEIEALLRPIMPDRFRADYCADFHLRDGSTMRWFQVVFAIGPGDTALLRTQVHELFPRMLSSLAAMHLASGADLISLRARRFCPDAPNPEHPVMFIEADWAGRTFRGMSERRDFSAWSAECITYRNHFDARDAFTRRYSGQLAS